ncbi:MAG: hypothetical protein CM15mV14_1240 [uncultured marine virus]|jgi:hypothetical protein|nr:MAG: hypothetical protein CM15mV14_1240 [uncultured marine virus]
MLNIHLRFQGLQNTLDDLLLYCIQSTGHFKMNLSPKSQTARLINRIDSVERFRDVAYVCEDFQTFVDEISEWGVDHIGGVDFYGVGFELNEELDLEALDKYFASFGCTPENPHPCSKYADPIFA